MRDVGWISSTNFGFIVCFQSELLSINATDGSLLKCVESFRLIFVEMLSSNFVASEEFSLFIDLIHGFKPGRFAHGECSVHNHLIDKTSNLIHGLDDIASNGLADRASVLAVVDFGPR